MKRSGFLLVTLVVAMVKVALASPLDLWQRLQEQERVRQAAGLMLNQYYPLWAQAAVLQLDDQSGRLTEPEDRMIDDDDYGYDLPPEPYVYGDEGDNVGTGVEEQVYKDLLLRYLLREMDKQESLPVVRRRTDYRSRSNLRASSQDSSEVGPTTSTALAASAARTTTGSTTTTTTPKPAASDLQSSKGQKEVAVLRPPSDSRHRQLTWPQELENRQTQDKQTQEKRMADNLALPTAPKKHPKEAFDILTAQLNSLRSRAQ